jgi:hypothetical protein
VYQGKRSDL